MGLLDHPGTILVLIVLGAAAFWRLTRSAGSSEALDPDDERADERATWWAFRTRRRREAEAQRRLDQEEANRLPR